MRTATPCRLVSAENARGIRVGVGCRVREALRIWAPGPRGVRLAQTACRSADLEPPSTSRTRSFPHTAAVVSELLPCLEPRRGMGLPGLLADLVQGVPSSARFGRLQLRLHGDRERLGRLRDLGCHRKAERRPRAPPWRSCVGHATLASGSGSRSCSAA